METEDLINRDRTWRIMICLNPNHATVKFSTNRVGTIKCPTCDAWMVVEVLPKWEFFNGEHNSQ